MLTKVYDAEPVSYDEILADYIKYAEALKPYVTDTNAAVLKAVKEDKRYCSKVLKLLCSTLIMVHIHL